MATLRPRLDESRTQPSPMDLVRSTLTDIEAAITRGDGQAVDLAVDEVFEALLAIQEGFHKANGTWAASPDTQSALVLALELPSLVPREGGAHRCS